MRIITWNMSGVVEQWDSTIPNLLLEEQADIICIQECGLPKFLSGNYILNNGFETSEGIVNYGTKNRPLNYHYFFCKADNDKTSKYNLAIISKHPINSRTIIFDHQKTKNPAIGITIKDFQLYTLQTLSKNLDNSSMLLDKIYEQHPNDGIMVTGDFNRSPYSQNKWTLHYLSSPTRPNGLEYDYAFTRGLNNVLIKNIPLGEYRNSAVKYKIRKL